MATPNIITAPHCEPPLSGLVELNDPARTLWNVYNAMVLLTSPIENMIEDCEGWGVINLLNQCKEAVAFEAERANFIMEQRKGATA